MYVLQGRVPSASLGPVLRLPRRSDSAAVIVVIRGAVLRLASSSALCSSRVVISPNVRKTVSSRKSQIKLPSSCTLLGRVQFLGLPSLASVWHSLIYYRICCNDLPHFIYLSIYLFIIHLFFTSLFLRENAFFFFYPESRVLKKMTLPFK